MAWARDAVSGGAVQAALDEALVQAPNTHAALVEQGGQLLAESYFTGQDKPDGAWIARTVAFDAGTLHDMRSITKSVVALLAGIAQGRGQLDPQRPVMDWFPEHADLATPERRALRLEHLLTMTAGLDWRESGVSYASLSNSETRLGLSRDPVRYVLSRETVAPPGERFTYSGGVTLLLAEVVEQATGQPIDVLAEEALFRPLGIAPFEWRRHQWWGRPRPYSGLRLRPRDMVALGRLLLNGGRWEGRALLPAAWVAALQQPHMADTGDGLAYGWQWWVGRIAQGRAAGTRWFAGMGNGGQVLMMVPALDATIAVTAGRYNEPRSGRASLAICRRVIAALKA